MPLEPLLPIFHRLNREYFDGVLTFGSKPILSLRWSDARLRKTAGFYRRGPNVKTLSGAEIVLSKPLLEHLPIAAIESTLCHEMIHAWVDLVLNVEEAHGPNFCKRMEAINSSQTLFQVHLRHSFPVPKSPPKWSALCPSCGLRFPYQRRVPGVACRQCCNEYHKGSWHKSCLLIYEPVLGEV